VVKPKWVVPMHFGTFPVLKGTPETLQKEMTKRNSKAQMRVLRPGEKLDISGS
jgi:L-ascorbate metabolism protein UlaG (beta-lactamase superfamily)